METRELIEKLRAYSKNQSLDVRFLMNLAARRLEQLIEKEEG